RDVVWDEREWRVRARRAMVLVALLVFAAVTAAAGVANAAPRVLRVGSYHGVRGQFQSIQKAVNAARRGDWILIGPGDYHEQGVAGASEPAGVLIRTPWLHLRGMNRNRVVVAGTKRGSPPCSRVASDLW